MASSARAYALGRPAVARARPTPGLLAAMGLAILAITGLIYISQTSSVANTGYDIAALQAQREQWIRRNDQLRLEIAKAQSLAHVEREAKTRLNMGPPARIVYAPPPSAGRIPPPADFDAPTLGERLASLPSAVAGLLRGRAGGVGD